MQDKPFSWTKNIDLLSGSERARLVIKDDHKKEFGDGVGFLKDWEIESLLRTHDYRVKREYDQHWEIYQKVPVVTSMATQAYIKFKCFYEGLKKAHVLLNISPVMDCLSELIKDGITDEMAKGEALRVADAVQVIKKTPSGKISFKQPLDFVKILVPKIAEEADNFIMLEMVVYRINQMMGFNVFKHENYEANYRTYINDMLFCIKEHNRIMQSVGQDTEGLSDYLIPEPVIEPDSKTP
jgi:hypothetical protein